ncbi:MAG: YceI family protein [Pseudomonadales bacterium]|nr:YceI family protein [Pseudomonadales bacterium]
MKKTLIALLVSCSAFAGFAAQAADYVFDKPGQHVFITFKASHLGYSYILGHFEDFEGRFTYNRDNPEQSKVSVTIETDSLDTDHAERDKHLKGKDYFNAAKYPTITFVSTGFQGTATEGKLVGDLTIKDVTRTVELAVRQIGEGKDPWGGYRSGFEGLVTLNAADYGLPDYIGDVEVTLIVEGIRQ